jgi:phytoene dehydrogenase-like protein
MPRQSEHGTVTRIDADAVVIGAGPNGLVAACLLADAGWDVVVVEAEPEVGGAVRSGQVVPWNVHDLFSSFYPLSAASPVLDRLDLAAHGLRWCRSPAVLAHLTEPGDAPAAVLHPDPLDTAAGLEAQHPGDGDTWLRLVDHWNRLRGPLLDALFTPLPAPRAVARLLARTGADTLWAARLAVLPVHRLGEELFGGQGGRLLLAGNAAHSDVPTVGALSGAFGWLLAMLGQDVGFPVPEGGSGRLSAAMASRARAAGARIVTSARAEQVVVRGSRALGVVCADGTAVRARRAVLATCAAPTLYRDLLADDVPAALLAALRHFEWDHPTIKTNWALREPMPWRAKAARTVGTVHLGVGMDELAEWSTALAVGRTPPHTFALVGQPAVADPSRAPGGGECLWAYSHLPRGEATRRHVGDLVERMEGLLESHAPGFRDLVVHRFVQGPAELADHDPSLVGGALNGGTAQLHQQLVFRPMPGTGRPETAVERLYLAGAGTHPGGGVHGAAGAQAALAALAGARLGGVPARVLTRAQRWLARPAPWDPPREQ